MGSRVPLGPAAALRRLADRPHLVCLDGGRRGASYLACPDRVEPLTSLDALRVLPLEGGGDLPDAGWPAGLHGGGVLQCDYDFPVGDNAAGLAAADARPRGWFWPCAAAHLRWRPGETEAEIVGEDPDARAHLGDLLARAPCEPDPARLAGGLDPAWDEDGHATRVAAAQRAIAAGDCYQINLTMPFAGTLAAGADRDLGAHLALRAESPAGFAAFLRRPGRTVISHSPECFLAADGTHLVSRPIKGTRARRRGREDEDRAALLSSAKDRAELAMIVDLVRNDCGRVAEAGSVEVLDPARVLDLDYVHHLEALVRARLAPGRDVADCLAAAFPAGSVTGAPKIRAMELIAELEAGARGAYCGCFGWLGSPRSFVLAVAIRTMTVEGDRVRLDAGGGIVADSEGAGEWRELRAKASRMAAALGAAC